MDFTQELRIKDGSAILYFCVFFSVIDTHTEENPLCQQVDQPINEHFDVLPVISRGDDDGTQPDHFLTASTQKLQGARQTKRNAVGLLCCVTH